MKEAILRVAPPCDQAIIDTICRSFERKLGKPVQFHVIEDTSLIGGFSAQVDGKVYDFSFSAQLGALHRQLSEYLCGEDDVAI